MEENLGFLQASVVEQVGGLESSISRAFENMGRQLVSMGETLERIRQNTSQDAVGPAIPPPPHFPPMPPPADGGIPMPVSGGNDGVPGSTDVPMPDVTGMSTGGAPLTPGGASLAPGGVPLAPGGTPLLPGYASGPVSRVAPEPVPASSHVSVPAPTPAKAGAVPGRVSTSSSGTDLVSIFLAFAQMWWAILDRRHLPVWKFRRRGKEYIRGMLERAKFEY